MSRSDIFADNGVKNELSMLNCKYIIEQMYCFVNPQDAIIFVWSCHIDKPCRKIQWRREILPLTSNLKGYIIMIVNIPIFTFGG